MKNKMFKIKNEKYYKNTETLKENVTDTFNLWRCKDS